MMFLFWKYKKLIIFLIYVRSCKTIYIKKNGGSNFLWWTRRRHWTETLRWYHTPKIHYCCSLIEETLAPISDKRKKLKVIKKLGILLGHICRSPTASWYQYRKNRTMERVLDVTKTIVVSLLQSVAAELRWAWTCCPISSL